METQMDWLNYFAINSRDRQHIPWDRTISVSPHVRKALIRSLQRFQVGEQGEGHHIKRSAAALGNTEYTATIWLFIAEEQEHSRLLAKVLHKLDAPLLTFHWSDICFTWLRRRMGLRHEIMVLLIAEMIAKRYYRLIYEATSNSLLQAVCGQILYDEDGHIGFHIDHLNAYFAQKPILSNLFVASGWRLLFRVMCAGVIWDHRTMLAAANISMSEFWRDCGVIFDQTSAAIFCGSCMKEKPMFQSALDLRNSSRPALNPNEPILR
jgi:hypothetical protein